VKGLSASDHASLTAERSGETRNGQRVSMSRRHGRGSTPIRRETDGEVRGRRQGNHASRPEMAIRPPGATPTGESSERTKGNNQRSRTGDPACWRMLATMYLITTVRHLF